jgi:hypothetical protein
MATITADAVCAEPTTKLDVSAFVEVRSGLPGSQGCFRLLWMICRKVFVSCLFPLGSAGSDYHPLAYFVGVMTAAG